MDSFDRREDREADLEGLGDEADVSESEALSGESEWWWREGEWWECC